MFALEITFADGASDSETVFVRRPHAVVGASEYSHVVISDLVEFPYELHLFRGIGRTFRTLPVVVQPHLKVETPDELNGEYDGEAFLNLGSLRICITALDTDLVAMKGEALDQAAARILRRACEKPSPFLPAVAITGDPPITISFASDLPLVIGRDRECELRVDSADVSGKHASIAYEHEEFFIEDLGSTNGTFISGQQISGRTEVFVGQPIVIGRNLVAYVLDSEGDVEAPRETSEVDLQAIPEERYPMLISLSEVVRPQRLVIPQDQLIRIGRDPSSDIWLGAPHVSRKHCTVEYHEVNDLVLTDLSLNGLAYDGGVLSQGESVQIGQSPSVLNFGGGITLAICFSEEQEEQFIAGSGDPAIFRSGELSDEEEPSLAIVSHSALSSLHVSSVIEEAKKRGGKTHVWDRFMKLRLHQRIAVLFTLFLGLLACALTLKLVLPMIH